MATNRTAFARLAAGTALASVLLSGCATGVGSKPANYAARSEAALAKGRTAQGIDLAEHAVLDKPRDAATRAMLGAAYLKAGRFASATEAYDAALELGDESVPTVLGLALSETAQGHAAAALELLNDWRDVIPAGDLGLAMALAGNASRGVAILSDALRSGENTVKVRQNLAFSYAMAGQWREARLMLAQDVPADQISNRISQWAQLSVPGADQSRVAHLLSVPVIGDSGQPAALALANFPSNEALAMAAGAPAMAEVVAPESAAPAEVVSVQVAQAQVAPAEVAAVQVAVAEPVAPAYVPPVAEPVAEPVAGPVETPAPVQFAALDQPASATLSDSPQFTQAFASTPVVQALAALPAQFRPAKAKQPRSGGGFVSPGADAVRPGKGRALTDPKSARPVLGGSHWLQLGSYVNPAIAKDGWGKFISRTPALKPYKVTTTTAKVNGTPVWRVAATGFASYGDAANMCRTVRKRGGDCLVVTAPKALGGGGVTARR